MRPLKSEFKFQMWLLEPMQRGDVRVIELRQETGLAIQAFSVLCKLFRKDFDGNVSSKFGVTGSINLSHPARTNGLDDFVLAELGAGSEGHG